LGDHIPANPKDAQIAPVMPIRPVAPTRLDRMNTEADQPNVKQARGQGQAQQPQGMSQMGGFELNPCPFKSPNISSIYMRRA
jgi:hypothetical protein